MMQSVIRRLLVVSLIPLIFACGGEDITDFTEVVDVRLGSLEVVSGGTLMLDENIVEEFDPDVFGAYRIDLDDDVGTSRIYLSVALGDERDGDAAIDVVQVAKGEDGEDRVERIASGDTFPVDVAEGTNLVFIRISSRSNAARAEYSLQIDRISSSSALQDIVIDNKRGSDENLDRSNFSEQFSEDVLTYSVSVDSDRCGVEIRPEPESRFAEVRVNGELTEWQESVFIPLPEGSALADGSHTSAVVPVLVEVTPEGGGTPATYTFNLQKDNESVSDIESDAFLRSLVISPGRELTPFKCNSTSIVQRVNASDVGSLSLTADIFDSRADAILTFGVDDELTGLQIDPASSVTLTPSVEYPVENQRSVSLFHNLAVGVHTFLLRVDSADGDTSAQYQIVITVEETNEVYVTNSEELQSALLEAEANDEIVIARGSYEGAASIGESGHESAHFYSAGNGTADQKIILRAESDAVILMGSDITEHSVLRLTGDYWEVEGIEFSRAQTGIVLDGADNVILKSVSVKDVGGRGVVMQNETSNSQLEGGFIDRTGTRDDIGDVSGEGVVIDEGENNAVRRVVFGRNISNEHIALTPESGNTAIQFNIFESDNTLDRDFENRSLISVSGGAAEISYNHFVFDEITGGDDDISQLIDIDPLTGGAIDVFQNIVDLDDASILAVNNGGAGGVSLADNRRIDSGEFETSGDTVSGITPVFQIQSLVETDFCLASRDVAIENADTLEGVVVAELCANEAAQEWVFSHTEEGYVQLVQNNSAMNEKMVPDASFLLRTCELLEDGLSGACEDDSYALQWSIETEGSQVSFANRAFSGAYISEPVDDLADDNSFETPPARVVSSSSLFENSFVLIPQ